MRTYFFLSILACLWLAGCAANPLKDKTPPDKTLPKPDPFAQNKLLAKSINLGNFLEAPNEGDWGVTLKASYFDSIAARGFSAVRIPIRFSAHTALDSPFTIDADFMDRVVWAVDQAEKNNLAAIVDLHHYQEIFATPQKEKTKFLSLWRQISSRFKDYPTSVFYEILNEPHDKLDADTWNGFLAEAITLIRSIDTLHTVIVGTAGWGGLSALNTLVVPDSEENAIVTVHYYEPFHFTHQGAEWVDGSDAWLGTPWQGTADEKNKIVLDFFMVEAWGLEHQRPIFLGEFGAYSKADMDSRVRWTSFIVQTAQADSMGWAYWEFASGFGAYDPQTDTWRMPLLRALIPQ